MTLPILRKADVKHMLPKREISSHKGENGRVLIIGGSKEYFGAPILAALGALNSGSDIVRILVPEVNFTVTRSYYPDFIVQSYKGDYLNDTALDLINELLPKTDTVLIGPGITETPEILHTIKKIILLVGERGNKKQGEDAHHVSLVLDAEAIAGLAQITKTLPLPHKLGERIVLTPNAQEFVQMTGEQIPEETLKRAELVQQYADNWGVTVLLKGVADCIAAPGNRTVLNETGNAGLTVGGTGDVLAGVVASFMAQHTNYFSAAQAAAYVLGMSGDLIESSKGFSYSATDVALELPYVIKGLS